MKPRLYSLVLLLALSAAPAFGQGCAMCYTSAKGASTNGQAAITRGVFTLLLPPIGLMLGLVGFAFRYKNRDDVRPRSTRSRSISPRVAKFLTTFVHKC